MSNKNRNFKKLLAAICGVASTLGGNAASAKGSNVKPANSAKNLAPAQGNSLFKWLKDNPGKSSAIVGGGVAFTAASILGVGYLLKDKEKPDGGPGGGNPQKSQQDSPQDGSQKGNPRDQKKTDTNPPQHNVYDFAFDQVKIRNFQKRRFFAVGDSNDQMANTTKNDVERDEAFLNMLKKAGIQGVDLQTVNYAAFTNANHDTTVYVVNARANSAIRNNFRNCNGRKGVPNMICADAVPDLLFFVAKSGRLYGTNWLVPNGGLDWGNQGTIRLFVDENTELK